MTQDTPDLFTGVDGESTPARRRRASRRKVRLLHVIRPGIGRAAKSLRLLLKHLDRTRFEPVVVASNVDGPVFLDRLRAMDVEVHELPLHPSLAVEEDAVATQWLCGFIRRGHFDLAHFHGRKAGFIGRMAARTTSLRPAVFTPHAFQFYYSRSPHARTLHRQLERTLGHVTDAMICASEAEAETVRRMRLVPSERLHVVPDGVDLDEVPAHADNLAIRASLGITCATRLITMVGRLDAPKDPGILIRASRHTLVPAPWNHIVFIGGGPMVAYCRDLARQLGIAKQVLVTGYRDDALEVARTSAIHVMSTREAGPTLSMLEGMAMGKPLIATDTAGVREVVTHGETGILVPETDERILSGALLKLIEDEDLAARLGANAAAHIRRTRPIDAWIRGIEEVYARALRQQESLSR